MWALVDEFGRIYYTANKKSELDKVYWSLYSTIKAIKLEGEI
jgi:hypothetical protein